MNLIRNALVASCLLLGSAAAASAEGKAPTKNITVDHSSGGTIERDTNGYKPGTFVPKDEVNSVSGSKVAKGHASRMAWMTSAFLPAAKVVGKQSAKKMAIAGATALSGPTLGLAIVIGGTAYSGYEAFRWFAGTTK